MTRERRTLDYELYVEEPKTGWTLSQIGHTWIRSSTETVDPTTCTDSDAQVRRIQKKKIIQEIDIILLYIPLVIQNQDNTTATNESSWKPRKISDIDDYVRDARNSYLRRKALEPIHQSTSSSDGKSQNKPFAPPFTCARESRGSSWACGERGHETERFIGFIRLFECLICVNKDGKWVKKDRLRCKVGTGSREYNQSWEKENSGQSKN